MSTALLYIKCQVFHYYGGVKFEFNVLKLRKTILSGDVC